MSGVYPPGHRLPNRSEIEAQFGVGRATVQKALDALIRDGFIHATPGAGTFVVDRPPHLCNIALISPITLPPSLFYRALDASAGFVATDQSLKFSPYHCSTNVLARGDWDRLVDDAAHHRFGALIFASQPAEFTDALTPLEPTLPKVAVMAGGSRELPGVFPDMGSFLNRAADYLRSRGRRRIAHLRVDSHVSPQHFQAEVTAAGLDVRPYWTQSIAGYGTYRSAADVVNLLMQLEGDKRPDGLIIHDDNLVDHAIAGLLASGVRVPDEIDVVAHANFPMVSAGGLPIVRLGFDSRTIIRVCLDIIDQQRQGEQPAEHTPIPAVFENEFLS